MINPAASRILGLSLFGTVSLFAQTPDSWYAFSPDNDHAAESIIGLENWNDEPAGEHGRILSQNDKLVYNGDEIKLWGINNTYADCAPAAATADRRVALYKKFGINSLRLHKYADGPGWRGIQSADSFVAFDAAKLDRMDYFVSELKKAGIYTKLSPTFGVRFGADDLDRVPYHAEIGNLSGGRIAAEHGWSSIAEEIHELQIDQIVALLNHTNPYTGLRYADDPAIFCVEAYNEDSVLFYGTLGRFRQSPTMRERHGRVFADWLLDKYSSEEAWIAAWGEDQIISGANGFANTHLENLVEPGRIEGSLPAESLAAGTVIPWASPWFNDAALTNPGLFSLRPRLLDSMEYLIGLQDEFYRKFVEAVRDTGYQGELIGSNWQAGDHAGHFHNLYSDYKVGMIDRHNYFGGGDFSGEEFNNGSMLSRPGMGSLSTGFQQVHDRPFMLSEWIHVQPNEWYAEGPAILGAYGWGLQGWDVSYIFQNNDDGRFSSQLLSQRWDVANPAILATFAAVSRQVRRRDVYEAGNTKTLNVHMPSMTEGEMSFLNTTTQDWDTKSFETDKVPAEALAATRVAVDFTEEWKETPSFDLSPYMDGDTVVSATGQLRWTPGESNDETSGYFTMNTLATKAFVGFAPGDTTFDLGDGYQITPEEGFAVIYITAKGKNEILATASEVIVTAMARTRNDGMQFNAAGDRIEARGSSPLRMEPVKATVSLPFAGTLELLDHDGKSVTSSRAFDGSIAIDGEQDQTPFYRINKEAQILDALNVESLTLRHQILPNQGSLPAGILEARITPLYPPHFYKVEESDNLQHWEPAEAQMQHAPDESTAILTVPVRDETKFVRITTKN